MLFHRTWALLPLKTLTQTQLSCKRGNRFEKMDQPPVPQEILDAARLLKIPVCCSRKS